MANLVQLFMDAWKPLPSSSPWATQQRIFLGAAAFGAVSLVGTLVKRALPLTVCAALVGAGLYASHLIKQISANPESKPELSAEDVLKSLALALDKLDNVKSLQPAKDLKAKLESPANFTLNREGLLALFGEFAPVLSEFAVRTAVAEEEKVAMTRKRSDPIISSDEEGVEITEALTVTSENILGDSDPKAMMQSTLVIAVNQLDNMIL